MKTIMFSENMGHDTKMVSDRALAVHHAAFLISAGPKHTEWHLRELLRSIEMLETAAKYLRRSIASRETDLADEEAAIEREAVE